MPNFELKICQYLSIAVLLFASDYAKSKGRYGELTFIFDSQRTINYYSDLNQNAVVLEIKNTSPEELKSLDYYDERLIKRAVVTHLGPIGVELKLILKDRDLSATVDILEEPFRVHLSIFDKNYVSERDPETNLPLANLGVKATGNSFKEPGQLQLLNDEPQNRLLRNTDNSFQRNDTVNRHNHNTMKRRLLQPTPEMMSSPTQLSNAMQSTIRGRGKAWKQFPIYIYPLQTASYEGRKEPAGWSFKEHKKALSDAQSMAEYGYKLYTFGHESRALVAYQQVLHKDPSIFNKDVLHLWAFSEIHLGQGNYSLADGYFQTLISNFPEAPLAKLASLRRLDIKVIEGNSSDKAFSPNRLIPALMSIDESQSSEITALKAIRLAYWSTDESLKKNDELPLIDNETQIKLQHSINDLEGQKTHFLASSLILKKIMTLPSQWQPSHGVFAQSYLARYNEESGHPLYKPLLTLVENRLATLIRKMASEGQFNQVIQVFESLPLSLKKVQRFPKVSWALAESYRSNGQERMAIKFYKTTARSSSNKPDQFRSNFWIATLCANLSQGHMNQRLSSKSQKQFKQMSYLSDRKMTRIWKQLSRDQQDQFRISYKNHIETSVKSNNALVTPANILYSSWSQSLTHKDTMSENDPVATWMKSYSPSTTTVHLLQNLAGKFQELGLNKKRKQTIRLLQKINPSIFKDDAEAKSIWSSELIGLADEYRQKNSYLEAGRLYTFTAENSRDWEDRAEALYKGGLLLYRAGKREESIKALTKASQDGNNLFFANLAKERLNQLTE